MIEVHSLQKHYGAVTALADLNLSIRKGRVTALVGPNASGKTTFIKTLLGLVKADAGSIVFKGVTLNGQPDYREVIGYMPQDPQFPENLRVSEVIALVKSIRSGNGRIDERLMKTLRVDRELGKRVGTLSGGSRQRVNAAMAFLFSPELVILDEPTAGLDPVSARLLKDRIREQRQDGYSVIITSHIMSDIEELADDVVFLCDGKLIFSGSNEELTSATGQSGLEGALIALMQGEDS